MSTQPHPLHDREEKLPPGKLHASQYIVVAILAVLVLGLWNLQVLGADNYRVARRSQPHPQGARARPARTHLRPRRPPPRRQLPQHLRLPPARADQGPAVDLPLISQGLHIPLEPLETILKRYAAAPKYQAIPLKQDITPDEQAFIEAHRNELPELETRDEQRRLYPRDGFAAHLIGYVGEVSEQMLANDDRYASYSPGDVVGKSGVEATYDALLRGTDGSRDVVVNSHGKEVGQQGQTLAVPGKDLRLTIDLDLQMAAEKALDGKNGAIVALDPHTGEVLAMVSRPTFDPNEFCRPPHPQLLVHHRQQPGSPAAQQGHSGPARPGLHLQDHHVGRRAAGRRRPGPARRLRRRCHLLRPLLRLRRPPRRVDIHNAIPYSCDTFFYTLANKLGIDTIAHYAQLLGLAQKTGIDLPDEVTGTMPSTAWKLKTQHEKWYAGETISVGIGQGAIAATPIQLARALGGIASGGVLHRPHVVLPGQVPAATSRPSTTPIPAPARKPSRSRPENWQIITDGMAQVTLTGTAATAHLEGIDFAGKTGTAQVIGHEALARSGKGHNTQPNAWFVGMAPRRNPDIVVAVLWEHGVWGKNSAALAAQVVDAFVEKQRRLANNLKIANTPAVVAPSQTEKSQPKASPGGI